MPPLATTTILLITPSRESEASIRTYLASALGLTNTQTNPDLHWLNEADAPITIEQVRDLSQALAYVPYGNQTQYYVLQRLDRASVPAQNALLKLIEEPPTHTQIILAAETTNSILPTILSRSVLHHLADQDQRLNAAAEKEAAEFYQTITTASPAQAVELAEKESDREAAKQQLTSLLVWLHQTLHQHLQTQPSNVLQAKKYSHHLKILLDTNQHLSQNVNVRLALEACFLKMRHSSHS